MLRNKVIPIALPLLGILLLFGLGLLLPGWMTERVGENYLGGSTAVSLTEVSPYGESAALYQKRIEQVQYDGSLQLYYLEDVSNYDVYDIEGEAGDWEGLPFKSYQEASGWYWGQEFLARWAESFGGGGANETVLLYRNESGKPSGWYIAYGLYAEEETCCLEVWLDGYTGLPMKVVLDGFTYSYSGVMLEIFADWLSQLFRENFSLDFDLTPEEQSAEIMDRIAAQSASGMTDSGNEYHSDVEYTLEASSHGLVAQLTCGGQYYYYKDVAYNYYLCFTFV